jgi:cytochrome c-type biogenesis protein CcmH
MDRSASMLAARARGDRAQSARTAARRGWRMLLAAGVLAAGAAAVAKEAAPAAADPALEARMVRIASELRCLVCQNQTIADSNAELANDLRGQIREQIAAGRSDDEILAYMVQRYGDFVLYQPPFKTTTVLLWAGPALLVIGGAFVLARNLRRRQIGEAPLSDDERTRARRLLEGDDEGDKK